MFQHQRILIPSLLPVSKIYKVYSLSERVFNTLSRVLLTTMSSKCFMYLKLSIIGLRQKTELAQRIVSLICLKPLKILVTNSGLLSIVGVVLA